jgi:tRNA dimethylallyltransferase
MLILSKLLQAPHKLYSFLAYDQQLSVGSWLQAALTEIDLCRQHQHTPIIVGGTGLYLNALVYGINSMPDITPAIRAQIQQLATSLDNQQLHAHLQQCDPSIANRLHYNDLQRIMRALEVFYQCGQPLSLLQSLATKPPFSRTEFFIVHVAPARELLYVHCNQRFIAMLEAGAVAEVESLMRKYPTNNYNKGIGVKELAAALQQKMSLEQAQIKAQQATRNYAKRQMTWLRHQLNYDAVIT